MSGVFLALLILSLLFGTFGGAHAAAHGGRAFATVALVCARRALVHAWADLDVG